MSPAAGEAVGTARCAAVGRAAAPGGVRRHGCCRAAVDPLTIAISMPIVSLPPARFFPLDPGHVMAWGSVGDDAAPPVLILHGGPGGRSRAASVNWFEGLGVRCIVHDQRGCGASTPAGALHHNDLDTLVADIERLREHLGLSHWAVAGGSWGALLAVAYAAQHPQRVDALFLRSAFLGSTAEVDHFFAAWPGWLGEAGAAWLAGAEAPQALRLAVRHDPVGALDALAAQVGDEAVPASPIAARIGAAWQAYEAAQAAPGGLAARPGAAWTVPEPAHPTVAALSTGLGVQWHYLRHGCFVGGGRSEGWLARLDTTLAGRPIALVHGEADAVCVLATSQALASRWPHAVLHTVAGAGHDMDQPALREALTAAAARWTAAWRPAPDA